MKLGEVVAIGIQDGILRTLAGKYFKSTGSFSHYFKFPMKNIKSQQDINFNEPHDFNGFDQYGSIKLRVIRYSHDPYNPTVIKSLIQLNELYTDYQEITEEEFLKKTTPIQKEIDKFD